MFPPYNGQQSGTSQSGHWNSAVAFDEFDADTIGSLAGKEGDTRAACTRTRTRVRERDASVREVHQPRLNVVDPESNVMQQDTLFEFREGAPGVS